MPSYSVRISELERELRKALAPAKVKQVRGIKRLVSLSSPQKLKYVDRKGEDKYIEADFIVGADGGNSWVRKNILHADFIDNSWVVRKKKMYGAVFNFDGVSQNEGVFKHVTAQHVKRVNLSEPQNVRRFFRGKGIYYIGVHVNEADAAQILRGEIPVPLKQTLNRVCRSVTPVGKNCAFSKLTKMTAFPIVPQRSTVFGRKNVFLVGDAAMTTHYFTGTGFNIGVKTALALVEYFKGKINKTQWQSLMKQYVQETAEKINNVV